MNKDLGLVVTAVTAATAVVVGMGLADGRANAPVVAGRSTRQMPRAIVREKLREAQERSSQGEPQGEEFEAEGEGARESENENLDGPAQQQYDQRAYPKGYISTARAVAARHAYAQLPDSTPLGTFRKGTSHKAQKADLSSDWQTLGPVNPVVPAPVTYTGTATKNSGRVTALLVAPTCDPGDCQLWMAAAGGGIWRTDDATAAEPTWTALDNGLTTNTFGSLAMDPSDPTTIYAGSGEPSGSSDSEAGLGLFVSHNSGDTWSQVPGSTAVAKDRSIAAILVDPNDSNKLWIGTALARHGSSSVNGGRRTPPDAPELGIYKSTNGGSTFTLEFSRPADPTPPATGSDFFTGGVRRLAFDPNDDSQIYASIQGYGLYRTGNSNDDPGWNQVFASEWAVDAPDPDNQDPLGSFTDFALADTGTNTRIYVGDTTDEFSVATFYTGTDVDTVSAADLLSAQTALTAPWELKSDDDISNAAGYSSYNWCQNGQCGYDAFIQVDPTDPDIVWLGGSMAYNELAAFGEKPISNGRAVVRSTDGGTTFTDMTNDDQAEPIGMHPDQRAIALNPSKPAQAFIGSDGGMVRTSGNFADQSGECDARATDWGFTADEKTFCQTVLTSVPTQIDSLDTGLNTLQFQSLTANSAAPYTDVIGGTQDNGTWAWNGSDAADAWFESVGGDGGQSGISSGAGSRMHTYYGTAGDVNFDGNDPLGWDYVTGPIDASGEASSFYVPMIADPVTKGTYFMGAESLWRTTDSGGDPDQLGTQCNELSGTGPFDDSCGDWEQVGPTLAPSAADYIVAVERSASDAGTMWAGLRFGDLFVSSNANAGRSQVSFTEIDTADTPSRFVSGIAVDPANPDHAWISYSGYSAYTPGQPGHVFEAFYDKGTGTATFTDRSYDLGDQPVTDVAVDWKTGDVYASTDFGVTRLASGATAWSTVASGLPPVATYGLTMDPGARVVYAATHGRGAYRVALDPVALISGPKTGVTGQRLQFDSAGSAGYQGTKVLWTFPDGTTASTPTAGYTPATSGAQSVTLAITDGNGTTVTAQQTVTVTAATQALTPSFGPVKGKAGGFTVQVTNFDAAFSWGVTSTAGKAKISDSGLVTVSGLKPGKSATVTVTTSRGGYPQGSASVTGSSLKQCKLTVKAKKSSYRLREDSTVKLVKKATTGKGCKVTAKVKKTKLTGNAKVSASKGAKKSLRVTVDRGRVKITATYRASGKAYADRTWNRSWRSAQG